MTARLPLSLPSASGSFLLLPLLLLLLLLLSLSLFVLPCAGAYVECTVGAGNAYPTIQSALSGCNGGSGKIKLLVGAPTANGSSATYSEVLSFPLSLRAVVIRPQVDGTRINLVGAGHFVDRTSWLTLEFVNVTFDGAGTPLMLFEPALTNTNLTMIRCFFVQFTGPRIIFGEPCVESTQWFFTDNHWADVAGSAFHFDPGESLVFERNFCRRCAGRADVDFGAVMWFGLNEISRGVFILNDNAGWALFDGQEQRCRYFLDNQANTRCSQVGTDVLGKPIMQLQCYDQLMTDDLDFCTEGSAFIDDPFGLGVDVSVSNTRLPYCRSYRKCECNEVLFSQTVNGTTSTVTLPLGNVVYDMPMGPDLVLQCIPVSAVPAVNGSYTCSEVFNEYGEYKITCAQGFTSGVLANEGFIRDNCTCPENRTRELEDLRDPDEFPCRYSFAEGLLCEEEDMVCCADPYWSSLEARNLLESCLLEAQLDGTVDLRVRKDFGELFIRTNPSHNDTHCSLQAQATIDGVPQAPLALAYYAVGVPHGVVVPGMGAMTLQCANAVGSLVGDLVTIDASFFGELIGLDVHGQLLNATWDYYRLDTSARLHAESAFISLGSASGDAQCSYHEELVMTLELDVDDPVSSFDSELFIDHFKLFNEYDINVVSPQGDNAGSLVTVEVRVNNTVCIRFNTTVNAGTPFSFGSGICAGIEAAEFAFSTNTTIVLEERKWVNYTLWFAPYAGGSGSSAGRLLRHSWTFVDSLLGGLDLIYFRTAYGNFEDFMIDDLSVLGSASYDVEVVHIPGFFEPVFFGVGCAPTLDVASCLIYRDCGQIEGDDGTVSACEVLNCTAQFAAANMNSVSALPSLDFLDSCTVAEASPSATPVVYARACVYQTDDFQFNYDLVDDATVDHLLGADVCLPLQYHQDPVNRPMAECPSNLFVPCSCAAASNTSELTNVTDSYWPQSNYTCYGGEAVCSCDDEIFGQLFPPPAGSAMYYISHLPNTLRVVQLINNRAQQLDYGMFLDRVSYELLTRFSIALPTFRDRKGLPRIVARQDNEYLWGVTHDVVQYPLGPAPRTTLSPAGIADPLDLSCQEFCDDLCVQDLVDADDYVCIVDKEVTVDTPGYGVYIFENITDAIEYSASHGDGCRLKRPGTAANKTIQVRFSEQYYDETMDITSDARNLYLISFDAALVSGSDHLLDGRIDNFQIRGFDLVHAQENKRALFRVQNRDLGKFTALNCNFFGEGVRSGGTIEGRAVEDMVFEFNSWQNWELYAARLLRVRRVEFHGNTIADSVGRSLYVEYTEWVHVDHNVLYETRGGTDFKEAAIITLRARNAQACQEWNADGTAFLPDAARFNCTLTHNIQHFNVFDVDYRDQCFWIDRGNWNAHRMNRNGCIKAQYGITLSNVDQWQASGSQTASDIRGGTLEWFSIYNPHVRPTLYRDRTDRYVGYDYRLRGAVAQTVVGESSSSSLFSLFRSVNKDMRNFNDLAKNLAARPMPSDYQFEIVQAWMVDAMQCEVNNNYDDCSMRWDFGPPLAPWGFDRVYPQHGFFQYNNVSMAVRYCADANVLHNLDPYIYVTSWNASRIRRDNITVTRDMWLIGDTSNPWTICLIEDNYPPVIAGHDHRVATRYLNQTLLEYWLDVSEDALQTEIWRSYNMPQKGMVWDRVIVDGRGIIPNSNTRVAYIECGEVVPTRDGKKGGIKNNKPEPPTACLIEMYNVTVRNFYDFEGRVVDPVTGAVEIVEEWPYTDGFRIRCVNLLNSLSQVVVQHALFENMDREGLEVYDCLRTYLMDSVFANCSGRSQENRACVMIDGNDANNTVNASVVFVQNVTIYQEKKVLFPTDGRPVSPAHVSAFWFNGFGNETRFCFFDNVAYGLEVGARFVETNRTIMDSCLAPNETYFFPDRKRELRALCLYGNNSHVDGGFHDLIWDQPGTQDRYRNNEWCDECCPLVDPTICYVDDVPELLVDPNPWYNRFLFGTICAAIEHCQARDRFIAVVGRQNTFGWFPDDHTDEMGKSNNQNFVPFKHYNQTLDCVVGPRTLLRSIFNSTTNTTENVTVIDYSPIVVSGSWGHHICASGHRLDSQQGVRIRLMGLNFTHCGPAATPLWNQPASYNSTKMKFEGNMFNGLGTGETPIFGTFDNGVALYDNEFENWVGAFGAQLRGRDCNDTLLTLRGNMFKDFPGAAYSVSNTQSLDVRANIVVRSGGQVEPPLWCVYLSVCDASTPGVMVVRDNKIRQQQQTAVAGGGERIAAFYLGNVYWTTKDTVIRENVVTAMFEIGMRFENMPGSDRSLLRTLALDSLNIAAQGTWHDLVEGPPSNDAAIDSDPDGERRHYCDDGCSEDDFSPFGYLAGALALLLFMAVAVYLLCCASKRAQQNTVYSQFLDTEVSINSHEWRELGRGVSVHRPDPRFSFNEYVPLTDAVNPEIREYQREADMFAGAGPFY